MASGDFASDILNRGQSAVAGWSRVFGVERVQRDARLASTRCDRTSIHPAFGIDSNTEYGIKGVPKDPRFYGGLPHMPIARFARLGGPFFRPQFQNSQVLQFAEQPDLAEGQPRAEVRRRVPARPAALHRPAIAQRRAEFRRRPLHRLRPRRFPARPVERAAADAVPRARPVCQRLAVLRAGQLARRDRT